MMQTDSDSQDQRQAIQIAVGILVTILGMVLLAAMLMPALTEFHQVHLAPGIGLKQAAVIAFFGAVGVLLMFAIAAGDGLLGEIQYMIAGFSSFFLFLMLSIAWVF